MRENLLTSYAKHAEVVEKTHLGEQHGCCISLGNKTAAIHGGENFGQFNALHFSAPGLVKQLLDANPQLDLGVWAMFFGEVLVKLRPALHIIFNSSAGHACIPAMRLLPWANDAPKLAVEATRFAAERTAAALAEEAPNTQTTTSVRRRPLHPGSIEELPIERWCPRSPAQE